MEKSGKINTLRENRLFSRLYSKGKNHSGKYTAVYFLKSKYECPPCIGITVSKSRGKAVVRNRIKRRIRESLRPIYPLMKENMLIVIVARQAAVTATYSEIADELYALLKRAQLLDDTE